MNKKIINNMKKSLLIILLGIFLVGGVYGQEYYVRSGASGNNDGSDWNNAWNDFNHIDWDKIFPGTVIYVSKGDYGSSLNVQSNGNSNNPIIIKVATILDNGNSNGWSNEYFGDVILTQGNSIRLDQVNYVSINGSYRYGFKILLPYRSCNSVGVHLSGTNNIIENVLIDGDGDDWASIGIRLLNSHNTIRNVLIKDTPNDAIRIVGSNHLIEDSYILPRAANRIANQCCSGNICHADGLEISQTNNITIRNNKFSWQGDTMIFGIGGQSSDNWKIYGNVFYDGGTAIKVQSLDRPHTNIKIYNNAFVNYGGFSLRTQSNNFNFRNNLFFNSSGGFSTGSNLIEQNDPFINQYAQDFRLINTSLAINTGETLVEEYSVDPLGNIRGKDGYWDIGAYEYVSDGQPQPFCGDGNCDDNETCTTCPDDCGPCTSFHPADTNNDLTLNNQEIMNYANCWKTNCVWQNEPSVISSSYLINAINIWKQGGRYVYNDQIECPGCWAVG